MTSPKPENIPKDALGGSLQGPRQPDHASVGGLSLGDTPMPPAKIPDGYILKARKIKNSPLSHCPPYVRETWDYLLREARWRDGYVAGKLFKRGQIFTSAPEIKEALSWFVGYRKVSYKLSECENAMKILRRGGMIATTRTGRGVIVTIVNYDFYQNPKNYESRNESRNESRTGTNRNRTKNKKGGEEGGTQKELKTLPPSLFDQFWQAFPKKKNKEAAIKAWSNIKPAPTQEFTTMVVEKINQFKQDEEWTKDGGQYIPYPSTWLNNKRWTDELEISKQGGTRRSTTVRCAIEGCRNRAVTAGLCMDHYNRR